MTVKKNTKDFYTLLSEKIKPFLEDIKKNRELGEQITLSIIRGGKVPKKYLSKEQPSRKFKHYFTILKKYAELKETLLRIEIASILIDQYPIYKTNRAKITATKWLRYNYENFLSEIYIFYTRIENILSYINKKCKKNNLSKESKRVEKTVKNLKISFKRALRVRGIHIHVKRWENTKILQLEMLELLSDMKDIKLLKDFEYKTERKKLSKEIKDTNIVLDKLLSFALEEIKGITFNKLDSCYKK